MIATGIGLVVGWYWPPAGVGVFVASLVVISLWGYLIPGTPMLTKRYFPDRVLRVFDKAGPDHALDSRPGIGHTEHTMADPEMILLDANAVEPCSNEDDLCLITEFRKAWRNHIDAICEQETERDDLLDLLGSKQGTVAFDDRESAFVATVDDRRAGQWESRAAFIADLAAARILSSRNDDWADLPIQARGQTLQGLRAFLNRCPVCDGPVTMAQDTIESCCRSHDVIAASCDECNTRLFEVANMPLVS